MTDVKFCKVQFERPPLAPERRPPGRPLFAPRSGPRQGTIRNSPTSRASRDLLAQPGAVRRGAGGSAAGTVEDSVGQQATLTSCQPGSDTPGSPVGLWAGDRPPSVQVRTIIPPQVHRPGQSGNPPLRQAGSRLLVNPDISNLKIGRRWSCAGRGTAPPISLRSSGDVKIKQDATMSGWNVRLVAHSGQNIIDVKIAFRWRP